MDDVLVGQAAAGATLSWGEHLRGDGETAQAWRAGKQGQHQGKVKGRSVGQKQK